MFAQTRPRGGVEFRTRRVSARGEPKSAASLRRVAARRSLPNAPRAHGRARARGGAATSFECCPHWIQTMSRPPLLPEQARRPWMTRPSSRGCPKTRYPSKRHGLEVLIQVSPKDLAYTCPSLRKRRTPHEHLQLKKCGASRSMGAHDLDFRRTSSPSSPSRCEL